MNRRELLKAGLNSGMVLLLPGAALWNTRDDGRTLAQEQEQLFFEREFFAMGTRGTLRLVAGSRAVGARALDDALARITYLEAKLTKFSPYSDIGRLNAAPGKDVYVSRDTASVLRLALDLGAEASGRFDVGMGNFLSRPGLDTRVPLVGGAGDHRGWVTGEGLRSDPLLEIRGRHVRLARPGTMLDLGGIGKGYAVREAIRLLRQQHAIEHAAIELGGDLAFHGGRSAAAPWRIGLDPQAPIAASDRKIIRISTGAVASSGGYRKRATRDAGAIKHHIVDPITRTSQDHYALATVVGPDAAVADALATAFFNTPADAAERLMRRFPAYQFHSFDKA